MTYSDLIQVILMGLLVVITGIYAWRTHVISKATKAQADASVRMAEEMRNARSPSIMIQWGTADNNSKKITANIKNNGFGPALNLECYLTHKELTFKQKNETNTTFEVGQTYQLSLPYEDFVLEKLNGLAINCDYGSSFGEKFRSILRCESDTKRMEIVKLNNGGKK